MAGTTTEISFLSVKYTLYTASSTEALFVKRKDTLWVNISDCSFTDLRYITDTKVQMSNSLISLVSGDIFSPTKFLNCACRNIVWEAMHLAPAKGMGCFQLEIWRCLISIGTQSPKCIMSILKYDERIEFRRNQSSFFHFHAKAPINDGITHLTSL